jgi:SlyX protein
MDSLDEAARRLTELEIKASFTEDLLDQLNQVIVRQQQQIDTLIREIGHLRQQIPEGDGAPPFAACVTNGHRTTENRWAPAGW